ncbi:signal peptidase I [Lysinibacillus sphaericus]|uniref:signal peptidase I n=1 Tax=Lysinibacillus sphaericus TaxID=1421 RepID=UPI0018CFB7AE|nr:signal peptidase I [Lysinibacillus sphaericus]MBG9455736.1 signal peptidase I [Lysinibacillus sphaericus]MBG9477755.1 signal peptidase I [Lysinibacillus sphaericus]MBG9593214.1 signal peptidase I [Lysinibacillus sphaericus]
MEEKVQGKQKNELVEWIKAIVFALLVAFAIKLFLFTPVAVIGPSMMPTLEDKDRVIVNRIGPKFKSIDRFDIVVVENVLLNKNKEENIIKRIIGLPGDKIEYKDDQLYINGEKFSEPYLDQFKKELKDTGSLTYDFTLDQLLGETTVPEGHYFVLGDNRRISIDSRSPEVGFIPKEKIMGTTSIICWPIKHIDLNFN